VTTDTAGGDIQLDEVLKKVVALVTKEHALTGNQLHELASHLDRMATHRIIQEQIRGHEQRQRPSGKPR
jgi:hypothetical protein